MFHALLQYGCQKDVFFFKKCSLSQLLQSVTCAIKNLFIFIDAFFQWGFIKSHCQNFMENMKNDCQMLL